MLGTMSSVINCVTREINIIRAVEHRWKENYAAKIILCFRRSHEHGSGAGGGGRRYWMQTDYRAAGFGRFRRVKIATNRGFRAVNHPSSFSQSERQEWCSMLKARRVAAMFGPKSGAWLEHEWLEDSTQNVQNIQAFYKTHTFTDYKKYQTATTKMRQLIFIWSLGLDSNHPWCNPLWLTGLFFFFF